MQKKQIIKRKGGKDGTNVTLITLLFVATIYDGIQYRIPNELLMIGVAAGMTESFIQQGISGLLMACCGIGIPVIMLALLHRLRVLGAADVKLLAMVGSFLGFSITKVILYSLLASGILAFIKILHNRDLLIRIKQFLHYGLRVLSSHQIIPYANSMQNYYETDVISMSYAILAGVLIHWLQGG